MRSFIITLSSLFILGACQEFEVKVTRSADRNLANLGENATMCEKAAPGGSSRPDRFWSGAGTAGDPYFVCTVQQLNLIGANYQDNHFKLIAKIDLKDLKEDFNQIALNEGSFDGGGHTVRNLKISSASSSSNGAGFFKHIHASTVKNLVFDSPEISFPQAVSVGIFGHAQASRIENVRFKSATITGAGKVGGLVGRFDDHCSSQTQCESIIKNVSGDGNIEALDGQSVGGIIGQAEGGFQDGVTLQGASFAGFVKNLSGNVAGGIVGSALMFDVSDVHFAGTVESLKSVGGVLGETSGQTQISGSSAAGEVVGLENAGGLIGNASKSATVTDSLALNDVNAPTKAGRLFGSFPSGSSYSGTNSSGSVNDNSEGPLIGHEYP